MRLGQYSMQSKKYVLTFFVVLQAHAAQKLRDPFSCSHSHTAQAQVHAQQQETSLPSPRATATDDASSEWRVIAQKGSAIIMQHRDGSIREVTVGKN